jgi:hypothetical protein
MLCCKVIYQVSADSLALRRSYEPIVNKFSPTDILLKFRKVKNMDFDEKNIITEVTKKVRELDKALKFNIFPTKNES